MIRNWRMFLCLLAALGALILEVEGSPYIDPTSSTSPFSSEEELQTERQTTTNLEDQPVDEPYVQMRIADCLDDADQLFVENEVEQKLNCQARIPDAIAICDEIFEKHKVCFSRPMKPIYRALILVVKSHYRTACLTIREQEKTQAEFNRQFIDDADTMKALFALSLYDSQSQREELQ
ncbi:uncharacterized protein [Drosophila bipectinata]|uniref:uncharacterized protein n=1 Tax=Drosophila bipectinata TaxID=42026 RepID=UPI001C896538|nr:uncharacterized protein LOC108132620 [Drosophila bipectinata]